MTSPKEMKPRSKGIHKSKRMQANRQLSSRNALRDIINLSNNQGMSTTEMQDVVENNTVSMSSHAFWLGRQWAMNAFLRYLVLLTATKNKQAIPTGDEERQQWFSTQIERIKVDLKSDSISFDDENFWVMYLHTYAMLGKGTIMDDNTASTNVKPHTGTERIQIVQCVPVNQATSSSPVDCASTLSNLSPTITSIQDNSSAIDIFQHAFDNDKNDMPLFENDENNIELFAKEDYQTYENDFHDESSFDSDDEATSSDDDDTECEKEPQLDQSLLQIVESLSPIHEDAPRLSINTLRNIFHLIKTELKNVYGKPVSRDTTLKVSKVLRYNALHHKWYHFGGRTKYWITERGIDDILATTWNCLAIGPWYNPVHKLLSVHTMILCLDVMGVRLASLVDSIIRPHNQIGRFLRWSMIRITLTGYEANGEASFTVTGSASGTKGASLHGDERFKDFAVATRTEGDFYGSNRDLALGFIALAVAQNSMEDTLRKAIFDRSVGEELLQHSSNRRHSFHLAPGFEFAPVFIQYNNTSNLKQKQKHITTDMTPGLPMYAPMTDKTMRSCLRQAGIAAGFINNVTPAHFRLSYSYKASSIPDAKIWEVTSAMCHTSENEKLVATVYQPTRRPHNIAQARFALDIDAAQSDAALRNVGALKHRLSPGAIGTERVHDLLAKLRQHNNGEITDDKLIDHFATVNGGHKTSIKEAKIGIQGLETDDWVKNVSKPHPFILQGNNQISKVVQYILDGGPYQCPACNKLHLPKHKGGHDYFKNVSKCYQSKEPTQCLCGICKNPVLVTDCRTHFRECFENWKAHLSVNEGEVLGFPTLCEIGVTSTNYWQQASYLVCPFECCLDFGMLEHQYPANKQWMKAIQIRKSIIGDESHGLSRLKLFHSPRDLCNHMCCHIFAPQLKDGELQIRFKCPIQHGKLMCGVYLCTQTFENSPIGHKAKLLHLTNDHKLPILMDKRGQYIKSIEAQNLDIDRLAPYQYYKKNTQFAAARQDDDFYFRWEASVREIH